MTHSPVARPPSCHDTNDCIVTHPWPGLPPITIQLLYRDTLHQPSRARPRCRPYRRPAVRIVAHGWPYLGVPLRAPMHPLGRVAPPGAPRPCLSRYNTVYRDSTTKWAVAHSNFSFFFFFFIFFLLIPATGKPPKNFFFFSFSSITK